MRTSPEERARHEDILRYWHAIELFTPSTVPKITSYRERPSRGASTRVVSLREGRRLPWEQGVAAGRGRVWQHTVYAGVFDIGRYADALREVFREPEDLALDARPPQGQGALLSFTVNQDGYLIKDSLLLCSGPWALSRALDPGPESAMWLSGFEASAEALLATVLELGDGKLPLIVRAPEAPAAANDLAAGSRWTRAIAGFAADVVIGVARSEVDSLASAVGAGIGGGVLGTVAAKAVDVLGDKLIDTAREQIAPAGQEKPAERAGSDDHSDDAAAATPDESVGTKALELPDLVAVTRWVVEKLGIGELLEPNAIRVKSTTVPERLADEAPMDELLNSFIAEDLLRVRSAAAAGDLGPALTQYLAPHQSIDVAGRIDVQRELRAVYESVLPSRLPLGAWPVRTSQPMALSQQFAVNRIMAELGTETGRGLYAVNGPPGTGKTYMLRDLIAAIVVQRAEKLALLADPADCLDSEQEVSWRTNDCDDYSTKRWFHPLRAELAGYEIVVASSNNGAVENVSLKTPALDALGEQWRDSVRYLHQPAERLIGEAAWGTIAAKLGRRKNRDDFVQDFWWGRLKWDEKPPEHGSVPGASKGRSGFGLHDLLMTQMRGILGGERDDVVDEDGDDDPDAVEPFEYEDEEEDERGENTDAAPLGSEDWATAVARFTAARGRVRALIRERQETAELQARSTGSDRLLDELLAVASTAEEYQRMLASKLDVVSRELDAARGDEQVATAMVDRHRGLLTTAQDEARLAMEQVQRAETNLTAYELANRRPRRFVRLLFRNADRRWQVGQVPWLDAVLDADEQWHVSDERRADAEAALRGVEHRLGEAATVSRRRRYAVQDAQETLRLAASQATGAFADVARRREELKRDRARLEDCRALWGDRFPRLEDWHAGPEDRNAVRRRELSSPWMDETLLDARVRLFVAALDLHRAVLANAPDLLRKNLNAALDVVKGAAPPNLPSEVVQAAWQLFFLVVPVVSTTFASVDRMFGAFGRETLGWLFIDEAGQASPPQAVGALWRSRRAVVVGDPRQLEPVVTLPWSAQNRIRAHFGVEDQWAPGLKSVQTIADRTAVHGTWIGSKGAKDDRRDSVWVGSPLRVHRRCDRLMFDVSNRIAYGGMMVYGKAERIDLDDGSVERSMWVHVPALPGKDKWNPAEGEMAELALRRISERAEKSVRESVWDLEQPWRRPSEEEVRDEVRGILTRDVFVISPFADVAKELKSVLEGCFSKGKAGDRIGTVHVTQGKEADTVIFVLGTGAAAEKSRGWASDKPNLLNVALTRAVRRIIVIGDLDRWSRLRGFDDLADCPDLLSWRDASTAGRTFE